jgi:peptidylprolyl isomerase
VRTRRAARTSSVTTSVVAGLLAALVLVGCDDEQEPVVDEDEAQQPQDLPSDLREKPDPAAILPAERGEPPSQLVVLDVVEGDGDLATAGSTVTVHYVGVNWSDGRQFDASWDRGQPFGFELGAGRVIPGWDQGVEGMRVGGRRILTIPPELAYGERGAGGVIGPNETLVFAVDLLEVSG